MCTMAELTISALCKSSQQYKHSPPSSVSLLHSGCPSSPAVRPSCLLSAQCAPAALQSDTHSVPAYTHSDTHTLTHTHRHTHTHIYTHTHEHTHTYTHTH